MAKKNLPTRDKYRHEQRSQPLPAVRQAAIPRIIQKTFGSIYFELFILAAVSLFLRWNLIDIPLERDEGSYAILGKMAMEGLAPYRDFYEMKPPFIFYTYGLLVELFGFSHVGLHWAAWFLGFSCVISVYFLAGVWFGVGFRFWGGLTFAFLLSNPYTTAVFLESELVVLAFVLPGILALLRVLFGRPEDMTRRVEAAHLWLSGFLIASGILVKQTGVYFLGYAIAMALLHLLFQGRNRDFSRFFSRSAWFLAGGATAGLIGASILTGFGVWDEFWYWNVEYIKLYTSAISGKLPLKAFLYGFTTVSKYFQYYWFAAVIGFFVLWFSELAWQKKLALFLLALFSLASVSPGLRFYHHYWLLFIPTVALMVMTFFYSLQHWLEQIASRSTARIVTLSMTVVFLIMPVLRHASYWSNPNYARIMRDLFPGNPFTEDKILADWLSKKIEPGQEIAVIGAETPYHIYLNQLPLTRHFFTPFLMRPTQYAKTWQEEALNDFTSRKPAYVIFNFTPYSWMRNADSETILFPGLYKWCMQSYDPVAWAIYKDKNRPEIILDSLAAAGMRPPKDGTPSIMLMKRKQNLPE